MAGIMGMKAIVTGAAQGIGYAIAKRFAEEGAQVMLADLNAEKLAAAMHDHGQPGLCVDVTDRNQLQNLVDRAIKEFGRVDVLVNNAGVFRQHSLLELSESEFDQVLAINLKSTLFGIQAVAPHMIARQSGAIINIASLAAVLAAPLSAAYCVSKAAVVQLTNVAAIELAQYGIRVNAVGPGTIETEMSAAAYSNPELVNTVLSRIPMRRPGSAEEIAGIALFLASADSGYVTGKTIYADGGRMGLNLTVPIKSVPH